MIVKNILLTGASSGIGEALALYYAKQPETENIFICPDIGRYQPPCYGKMDKRS